VENARSSIDELSKTHPIVFFDGVCGLCSAVVDWIMAHDKDGKFHFSPLQGETAFLVLNEPDRHDLDSIIILKNARDYKRSDAIVEILIELKTPWKALGWILKILPRPLRDLGYKIVARFRYRIWGKSELCRLPTPQERARFLN
jgi:predicted DCC family thiol-disulfide oxidoreductase YuxK